jgi:hypothetical protein
MPVHRWIGSDARTGDTASRHVDAQPRVGRRTVGRLRHRRADYRHQDEGKGNAGEEWPPAGARRRWAD